MRKTLLLIFSILTLSLPLVSGVQAGGDPEPVITPLYKKLGDDYALATDISDTGIVVGYSARNQTNPTFIWFSPMMWKQGSTLTLPTLPYQNSTTSAHAVNNAGETVGTNIAWQSIFPPAFPTIYGTYWESDTSVVQLSSPSFSEAHDINNESSIAGTIYPLSGSGRMAVIWDSNFAITPLGYLPGGGSSEAKALNDLGYVTGNSDSGSSSNQRTFLWNPLSGGMVDLAIAPNFSENWTQAINNNNQIAGYASGGSTTDFEAFIVDESGDYTMLGDLTPNNPSTATEAYDINDDGIVVGKFYSSGVFHAVAWKLDQYGEYEMIILNSLLPTGSGWTLDVAYGVDSSGNIVGSGTYYGESVGFIFTGAVNFQ